jgi:pullulanase/glycogen debranching enzyme
VSWLDWSLLDRHRDLHQFVRKLIADRLRLLSAGDEESFGLSLNHLLRRAEIDWHGVWLGRPDWSDYSHSIAFTVRSRHRQIPLWLHVMFNAYWEALDFELPLSPAAAVAAGNGGSTHRSNRPRTLKTPLPPHRCPECNTAWRLVPWRRCLSELVGAADPSSS